LPHPAPTVHAQGVDHLVVFARWPEPGQVKTRLSPALPPELAAAFYEAMVRDTIETGRLASVDRRYLYWLGAPPDRPWSRAAREAGYRETLQRGSDLGTRLEAAFEELLSGPGEHVVVVGTDAPELSPALIAAAFARLASHDLVLGPTLDGGYYLVGLGRRAPEIFHGIPWGTDQVLARTLERAGGAGLTTALLDPLSDVDVPADLVQLMIRCLAAGAEAPTHTAGALRELGLLPGP